MNTKASVLVAATGWVVGCGGRPLGGAVGAALAALGVGEKRWRARTAIFLTPGAIGEIDAQQTTRARLAVVAIGRIAEKAIRDGAEPTADRVEAIRRATEVVRDLAREARDAREASERILN